LSTVTHFSIRFWVLNSSSETGIDILPMTIALEELVLSCNDELIVRATGVAGKGGKLFLKRLTWTSPTGSTAEKQYCFVGKCHFSEQNLIGFV